MISWPFFTYMSEKDFDYMIKSTKATLEYIRSRFE